MSYDPYGHQRAGDLYSQPGHEPRPAGQYDYDYDYGRNERQDHSYLDDYVYDQRQHVAQDYGDQDWGTWRDAVMATWARLTIVVSCNSILKIAMTTMPDNKGKTSSSVNSIYTNAILKYIKSASIPTKLVRRRELALIPRLSPAVEPVPFNVSR
jgi:hypothetical protein